MRKGLRQMVKFGLSSLSGFAVDYLMYALFLQILGEHHLVLVNSAARVISASVNFTLNRWFVFDKDETLRRSAGKYALLAIVILALNTGVLCLLTQIAGIHSYAAKVLTEMILFLINWLVQKKVVFCRKTGKEIESEYLFRS